MYPIKKQKIKYKKIVGDLDFQTMGGFDQILLTMLDG